MPAGYNFNGNLSLVWLGISLQRSLGAQEFMVIAPGGAPVFHHSNRNTKRLDELLSGFLSAITAFANEFGEQSVQSLSFEGSELLYEHGKNGLIFVLLIDADASETVLRAVLKELSKRFQNRFSSEIGMEIPIADTYQGFDEEVNAVVQKYRNILKKASQLNGFVVPQLKTEQGESDLDSAILDELHRDYGNLGVRVLESIDGNTCIHEIKEQTGLEESDILEIIEHLIISGAIEIKLLCPSLLKADSRFETYLDLIGLPQKDFQILQRARIFCDGQHPLTEISEKIDVSPESLFDVLSKMGDTDVEWLKQDPRDVQKTNY